ncbi:nesprin-1-like isoform X2 [Ascaphus truei]|uniref:nesprin-1-like isoform X2 n=1 Tax=Ascaphus truei TaxID=8439 RepID=UPI003F59A54B
MREQDTITMSCSSVPSSCDPPIESEISPAPLSSCCPNNCSHTSCSPLRSHNIFLFPPYNTPTHPPSNSTPVTPSNLSTVNLCPEPPLHFYPTLVNLFPAPCLNIPPEPNQCIPSPCSLSPSPKLSPTSFLISPEPTFSLSTSSSDKLSPVPFPINCPPNTYAVPSPNSSLLPCAFFPPPAFNNSPVLHSISTFSLPTPTDLPLGTNVSKLSPAPLLCCVHAIEPGTAPHYFNFPEEHSQEEVSGCKLCTLSVEKRIQMEHHRQLCAEFLDSLSRFEDWLQGAQVTAAFPNSSKTLYSEAKAAVRRYEVLLRDMREKLLDLESLNRQYWRLMQAPHRALLPSVLRSRMHEVNQCWDKLQRETEAMQRRLKLKVRQREEFESDKEEIRLWLTEMDLGLSNVEHFYSGTSTEKILQLQAFQEDVKSNMERMEGLFVCGEQLMEGSEALDSETLEMELTELGCYCQGIFSRLSHFQKRLVSTKLVFEDDTLFDGEMEVMSDGSSDVFLEMDSEGGAAQSPFSAPCPPLCSQTSSAQSVTLDLEWDPLGDVGRSTSNDEDELFYTPGSWKGLQWEGSQTSDGSITWTGGSRAETRRDTEHLRGILKTLAPSHDTLVDTRGDSDSGLHSSVGEDVIIEGEGVYSASHSTGLLDSRQKADYFIPAEGHWPVSRFPGDMELVTPDSQVISGCLKPTSVRQQRRRYGHKSQLKLTRGLTRKPQNLNLEVSIPIEKGVDKSLNSAQKTLHGSVTSLWGWTKRLASLSILVLLLGGSVLILPLNHPVCSSHHYAWSLMLTYVNGPPPT